MNDFQLETQTPEQIQAEKEAAKHRERMIAMGQRAAQRLTGSAGDLTADMFGEGEGETPLFNSRRNGRK